MENKKIIISIVALIFLSMSFLIYRAENMPEPNWWVAYFSNAKDLSSDFVIENHSEKNIFHWQALVEKNKVVEGDIEIEKDQTKSIVLGDINPERRKIIIEVFKGEEKREIYKNL